MNKAVGFSNWISRKCFWFGINHFLYKGRCYSTEQLYIIYTKEKIDEKIEEWHGDDLAVPEELHDYLGMTFDEYARYVDKGIIPDKFLQ